MRKALCGESAVDEAHAEPLLLVRPSLRLLTRCRVPSGVKCIALLHKMQTTDEHR